MFFYRYDRIYRIRVTRDELSFLIFWLTMTLHVYTLPLRDVAMMKSILYIASHKREPVVIRLFWFHPIVAIILTHCRLLSCMQFLGADQRSGQFTMAWCIGVWYSLVFAFPLCNNVYRKNFANNPGYYVNTPHNGTWKIWYMTCQMTVFPWLFALTFDIYLVCTFMESTKSAPVQL